MWFLSKLALKNFEPVNCKLFPVTAYSANRKKYLTPVNAAETLLTKVDGSQPLFCLMINETTEDKFITKLSKLSECWALPDINNALRVSKTLTTLDTNKMIIPSFDSVVDDLPLSSSQSRLIDSAKNIGNIKPISMSQIKTNLNEFEASKNKLVSDVIDNAQKTGTAEVELYSYFGFASDVKKHIPNENHVFTFMLGFTGIDIIKLVGLVT